MTMKQGEKASTKKIPKQGGFGDSSASSSSASSARQVASSTNWIAIPATTADVENVKEGKVQLIDTMADSLMDSLTNPTGAVSIAKYSGDIYCFSSSCPSCKIPMSGAKVLPVTPSRSAPLIACTFCKNAYDLKSGKKTEVSPEEAGGGLFAGLAKSIFKSTGNGDPLPRYQLGEKDGKLLINVRQ